MVIRIPKEKSQSIKPSDQEEGLTQDINAPPEPKFFAMVRKDGGQVIFPSDYVPGYEELVQEEVKIKKGDSHLLWAVGVIAIASAFVVLGIYVHNASVVILQEWKLIKAAVVLPNIFANSNPQDYLLAENILKAETDRVMSAIQDIFAMPLSIISSVVLLVVGYLVGQFKAK